MDRKRVARELLRLAKELAGSAKSILKKYPMRNKQWDYQSQGDVFVTFASDLGRGTWLDPWNRPMRTNTHKLKEVYDGEGELVSRKGYTTVEGKRVNLTIFND